MRVILEHAGQRAAGAPSGTSMFCRHDAHGIVSMLGAAVAGAGVGVDGRGPAGAGGITAGKGAVG